MWKEIKLTPSEGLGFAQEKGSLSYHGRRRENSADRGGLAVYEGKWKNFTSSGFYFPYQVRDMIESKVSQVGGSMSKAEGLKHHCHE